MILKLSKLLAFLMFGFLVSCTVNLTTDSSNCSSTSTTGVDAPGGACVSDDPSPNGTFNPSGNNVLTVAAGGCGHGGVNMPCANITICEPGTATCQLFSNVLIDTGSFGLRLFKSKMTITPTPMTIGGKSIGECALFGTGSDWGQVAYVDLQLANEPTIPNLPIQVIDSSFATVPSVCGDVDDSPADAGFDGIMGVGLWAADCGPYCTSVANSGYYTWDGSTRTKMAFGVGDVDCSTAAGDPNTNNPNGCPVQNPVAYLPADTGTAGNPQDNNGVVLEFPHVANTGSAAINGYVLFGVGTRANNTPAGVTTFTADSSLNFTTSVGSFNFSTSFIDSGSNGLFFPFNICTCDGGFYCSAGCTLYDLTATNTDGVATDNVDFQIANLSTLLTNSPTAVVFSNIGGGFDDTTFDWGFPFFLGRAVYNCIDGQTCNGDAGPYWAY
jgi:hypothetical protein